MYDRENGRVLRPVITVRSILKDRGDSVPWIKGLIWIRKSLVSA
jgi:hypothetical protein